MAHMITGNDLKAAIKEWAERVGKYRAKRALLQADVGYTTAIQLMQGTYVSEPQGLLTEKLNGVLAKEKEQAS